MEKWLILLSVFKNFLQTEIKSTWWSWAKDISLSIVHLMCLGVVGFGLWALYSYLRGYSAEAIAAMQMSVILLGIVIGVILLFLLIKKIMKKYLKHKAKNVYGELFGLSNDLYQDAEKIKDIGLSVFKKNPLIISSTVLGSAYLLYLLFKDKRKNEIVYKVKK